MQAFVLRRGLFAASILVLTALAATGRADDGGADAGEDAGATALADASADAAQSTDATVSGDDAMTAGDSTTSTGDDVSTFDLITSDAGPVMDDGLLPTYTGPSIWTQLCLVDPATQDPTAAPYSFSSVQPPYTDVAGCMQYQDNVGHTDVHNCYCNSCFDTIQQCDALEGCKEILKCELDSGCTDADSCYFTSGCGTVIDKWNNTSLAAFITSQLETCVTANNCPKQ